MEYVEILRARRVLFWFVVAFGGTMLLNVISLSSGGLHVSGHIDTHDIPVSAVLMACALVAFVITTCVSPGLSSEGATVAITWTRPVPRWTTGARFVAVDLGTVALAYLVVFVVGLAVFQLIRSLVVIVPDADAFYAIALGAGVCVMWYGLILLTSARFPGRGGMIAGLSWVVFLVLSGIYHAPLPWLIHDLIVGLNYLNPLAYFGSAFSGSSDQQHNIIALGSTGRAVVPWCIGIASIAAGIRLWSTREA